MFEKIKIISDFLINNNEIEEDENINNKYTENNTENNHNTIKYIDNIKCDTIVNRTSINLIILKKSDISYIKIESNFNLNEIDIVYSSGKLSISAISNSISSTFGINEGINNTIINNGNIVNGQNNNKSKDLIIYLPSETIYKYFNTLNQYGSGDISFKTDRINLLNITLKGSGDLTCGISNIKELNIVLKGSGDINIGGYYNKHNDIGYGKILLQGSGDIKIDSINEANITLYGSGDIVIPKTTKINNQSIKGSGEIHFK